MLDKGNRASIVSVKEYPPKTDWYNSNIVYKDLVTLFELANSDFLEMDMDLIHRNTAERAICGALMAHLRNALSGTPFCSYYVDVEYNRNKNGKIKTIIDEKNVVTNITCDLIVHSRGACIDQDN